MTMPSAARAITGANEMTSEPMADRATEIRLMRRSLPWELASRLVRTLWRAGSRTTSRTKSVAALSVSNILAYKFRCDGY